MLTIPIADVPSQTFRVNLAGQNCNIALYQKRTGFYLDLRVGAAVILTGVICRDRAPIVIDPHFGFVGDLYFEDTQGLADPQSPGLGTRYLLRYAD